MSFYLTGVQVDAENSDHSQSCFYAMQSWIALTNLLVYNRRDTLEIFGKYTSSCLCFMTLQDSLQDSYGSKDGGWMSWDMEVSSLSAWRMRSLRLSLSSSSCSLPFTLKSRTATGVATQTASS